METTVTREMISAAHGVTLQKGDVILSADLLTRIYLAMDALVNRAETSSSPSRTLSDEEIELIWNMTEFHGGDDWNAALEFARAILEASK